MKRLPIAAAISIALAANASAADIYTPPPSAPMYTKAPLPAVYSWTGFYVGGNFGYGFGIDPTTQGSAFPDGDVGTYGTFNEAPHGALGGGQIGYNWQFDPHWLVGAEADWQWSGQRDSSCQYVCPPVSNGPPIAVTQDQRLSDFGTARVRLGYAQDRWLWYATGGFAWGRVNQTFALAETAPGFVFAGSASDSHNLTGWTAGGGVETKLWGRWSAKLEYLYADLGSVSDAFTIADPPGAAVFTSHGNIRDNVVRVGLDYNFGAAPVVGDPQGNSDPPLIRKAPPAAAVIRDWSGFYLGGNGGYGVGLDPTTVIFAEPAAAGFSGVLASLHQTPQGGLAGGQFGYNWQFSAHGVVGAEADWQWSGQRDSICVFFCAANAGFAEPVTVDQRLRDFGTARARLGYAQDRWLWYTTGGFAWGTVHQTLTFTDLPLTPPTAVSTSHSLTGWTVGGGVETALWGGWSAKLEYLYVDLGSISDTIGAGFFVPGTSLTGQSEIRDNVVRVGLNYKLGWIAPLGAKD